VTASGRKPVKYFAILVHGYESPVLAYQIYKGEVYVSRTGRFCGPGKERRFEDKTSAEAFVERRSDREKYQFEIVEITSWE
jgi:hypothetical protein